VEFQVTSGSDIDVLLMTPSDYTEYQAAIQNRGTIKYIEQGSVLKKLIINTLIHSLKAGIINLCSIIRCAKIRRFSYNQVEMTLKVSVSAAPVSTPEQTEDKPYTVGETPVSTPAPKTSGFEGIIAAFVIVTLVMRRR